MNVLYEAVPKNNFYSVSLYHLPKGKQTFIHYHDVLELGVCLEGSGQCITDKNTIEFKKVDTQIILPYQAHYDIPNNDDTLWMFISIDILRLSTESISFSPLFTDNLLKTAHSDIVYKSDDHFSEQVKEIASLIQSEKSDHDVLALKTSLLLKELATETENESSSNKKSISASLHLVSSYIKEGRRPTPKEMADACFMSESYFRKIFTLHMGEAPKSYITRMQLQKATEMLKNESIHITDIALLCGFDDFTTFFRSFKKFYGISPSKYRTNT